MIRKLRSRFIRVCMTAMLIVLLVLLLAINGVNAYNTLAHLDFTVTLIADNNGTIPFEAFRRHLTDDNASIGTTSAPTDATAADEQSDASDSRDAKTNSVDRPLISAWGQPDADTPFMIRYFTVYFDAEGNISDRNLDSIAAVPQEEADAMAQRVWGKKKSGWLEEYRYSVVSNQEGGFVLFVNAARETSGIKDVLLISLIIGAISYLLIFLIVFLLSRQAIRPFAENIEKQKHFITDASHELKTPLTVIATNAEIMEMNYGDNEWSQSITRHIERMRKLIDQMVSLSRLDEDSTKVELSELNLSDAVYDTAMTYEPLVGKRGLSLKVDIDSDICVRGDEALLRRLTAILMDNAIKYCDPSGSIHVRLARGVRPVLSIDNSYRNINQISLERIFDRFYRGDEAHSGYGSYGLGLAIAQSIAQNHNGTLKAEKLGTDRIRFAFTLSAK